MYDTIKLEAGNPVTTGIEPTANVAEGFSLCQNYPNPFNPTTTIQYSLNKPGLVTLTLYNLKSRKVAQLVHEEKQAGFHQTVVDAKDLSSGLYYYRLKTNGYCITKKMMVIK